MVSRCLNSAFATNHCMNSSQTVGKGNQIMQPDLVSTTSYSLYSSYLGGTYRTARPYLRDKTKPQLVGYRQRPPPTPPENNWRQGRNHSWVFGSKIVTFCVGYTVVHYRQNSTFVCNCRQFDNIRRVTPAYASRQCASYCPRGVRSRCIGSWRIL